MALYAADAVRAQDTPEQIARLILGEPHIEVTDCNAGTSVLTDSRVRRVLIKKSDQGP